MKLLRGACLIVSVAIALVAVLLGLLFTGALAKTGVFAVLDGIDFGGGQHQFKGMFPAMHAGTPWGFTLAEMPDLTGHVCIVTGANIGLGYWTAHHLAAAGATVVLGCRSMDRCAQAVAQIVDATGAPAERVVPMQLDLSSFKSVRAFASAFIARFPALDALVLNAAVMGTDFTLTEDGLELQIGTNHFGHQLLTVQLLPALEAAGASARGPSTVTAVSSMGHWGSYPEGVRLTIAGLNNESAYNRVAAYGQSKLANILFARELALRVGGKNILSNAVHPGGVATNLAQHFLPFLEQRVSPAFAAWLKNKVDSASWHPRDASLTQLYTAVGPSLKAQRTTGAYFHPIARQTQPSNQAQDATMQRELWDLTEAYYTGAA